jgi:hypothetical protein
MEKVSKRGSLNASANRRTAEVSGNEIATTDSAWSAELGVDSPLVEDLAQAVRACDWAAAAPLASTCPLT